MRFVSVTNASEVKEDDPSLVDVRSWRESRAEETTTAPRCAYSSTLLAFSLACSRALGFTDSWNGTSETVA